MHRQEYRGGGGVRSLGEGGSLVSERFVFRGPYGLIKNFRVYECCMIAKEIGEGDACLGSLIWVFSWVLEAIPDVGFEYV